ncbi:MAG: hypothetical protein IJL70_01585 [Treponema sp.]|nr:hypothetical protein [Treponema sp.]
MQRTYDGKEYKKAYPNYSISVDYIEGLINVAERVTSDISDVSKYVKKAETAANVKNPGDAEMNGLSYSGEVLDSVVAIDGINKSVQSSSYKKTDWGRLYRNALEAQKEAGYVAIGQKERKSPGVEIDDRVIEWGGI